MLDLALVLLLRPAFLAPAALLTIFLLHTLLSSQKSKTKLPANLPIIGALPSDIFPFLQAAYRNTRASKPALQSSYHAFSRRGRTALLPTLTDGTMVLLPAAETRFVVDQPDSVLDMHAQVEHKLMVDHTMRLPRLVHDPLHHGLVSTTLTPQIGALVPELADEVARAVPDVWPSGPKRPTVGEDPSVEDQWTEVCVYDAMRAVIGRATNRVFVSAPLCRDAELLDLGIAYAMDVPLSAALLQMVWAPVRPLVALVVTLPNWWHWRKFVARLRPEIERRLAAWEVRHGGKEPHTEGVKPEEGKDEGEKNDFLQWSIHQAKATSDPWNWRIEALAGRILLMNFAAIHTSSFALTNTLLDLAGSDPGYISQLRTEIETVLAAHNNQWTKRALAQMEKLDSTLRESARLNSFVTVGLSRRVVHPSGLTTPSGLHIPAGNTVVVPGYGPLHDGDIYPDPEDFRPFRFAEQRADETKEYVQRSRQAFATTSCDFLAFGHGRSACPGRFFAASEMKLILGYLLLEYEFERLEGGRPSNVWVGLTPVPPMKAVVRLRRRVRG